MNTMESVLSQTVPPHSIALWSLGQMGYILKSPQGKTIAIDPYLTNSCMEGGRKFCDVNCDRRYPPPVEPEDLDVDVLALTHSHQDHCDAETILRHRTRGFRGPYLAPGETMDLLITLGVPRSEIILSWPNKEHRFDDLRFKSTFAIPARGDDLTHMGYLVFVDSGPTIYFTGDTDYHDVLEYIADYKPDVMVVPINGCARNLGPNDATRLTQRINPKIVIPCHYDVFPDDGENLRVFRRCLIIAGMKQKFVEVKPGESFIYPRLSGEAI